MCYYDDDFFYEPSEFEEKVNELKESLTLAVKEDILAELKKLREENESLKDFKEKKEEYERELQRTKNECDRKIREAEENAKKMKLREVLDFISVTGYRPKAEYIKKPKCDKCDKYRKIHYITPMGREAEEYCKCNDSIVKYSTEEVKLVKFDVDDREDEVTFHYEKEKESEYYVSYSYIADVYRTLDTDFNDINSYKAVFLKKEDCQRYCEWLEKKKNKEG